MYELYFTRASLQTSYGKAESQWEFSNSETKLENDHRKPFNHGDSSLPLSAILLLLEPACDAIYDQIAMLRVFCGGHVLSDKIVSIDSKYS